MAWRRAAATQGAGAWSGTCRQRRVIKPSETCRVRWLCSRCRFAGTVSFCGSARVRSSGGVCLARLACERASASVSACLRARRARASARHSDCPPKRPLCVHPHACHTIRTQSRAEARKKKRLEPPPLPGGPRCHRWRRRACRRSRKSPSGPVFGRVVSGF